MRYKLLCAVIMGCLLLSGCRGGKEEREPSGLEEGVTFTDDLGRTITVSRPQRVAALLGSYAHIWTLAGGTVCASADDAWEDYHLELPEGTVNLGNTKRLSFEKLLEAEPDFILASTNSSQHLEWKEELDRMGIPAAYFDVADFDGYLRMLEVCTKITGEQERYQQYGLKVQKEIDRALQDSRKRLEQEEAPKILFLRASAASIRAKNSEGNVLGEMLRALGCINIADSDEYLLENVSMEHIIKEDPDFIFFVQQGDDDKGTEENIRQFLQDNPVWAQLTAVKEDRVFYMDKMLYGLKPNHRWGEAYGEVEKILENR